MAKPKQIALNMQRPICKLANSIQESDLELAVNLELLATLAINETEQGYYVTATFQSKPKALHKIERMGLKNMAVLAEKMRQLMIDPAKVWYLTTRRERTRPRLHRSLSRLNDFLREKFPTDSVVLMRNQAWPSKAAGKTRGAKAKQ